MSDNGTRVGIVTTPPVGHLSAKVEPTAPETMLVTRTVPAQRAGSPNQLSEVPHKFAIRAAPLLLKTLKTLYQPVVPRATAAQARPPKQAPGSPHLSHTRTVLAAVSYGIGRRLTTRGFTA